MKSRHTGLALLGLVAGTTGAYWAARAYRRARVNCAPFRRRVYRSSREVIESFGALWHNPAALYSLRSNPDIRQSLVEKIMLAVSGASGSPFPRASHARHVIRRGLSPDETESLLRGEVNHATVDEATALFFARQYAESQGQPDPDLVQGLISTYGQRTASDLITCIRLVTLGSLVGNTFDAFLSRLLGKPSPDSTLGGEVAALATFLLGIAPLSPALVFRAYRTATLP